MQTEAVEILEENMPELQSIVDKLNIESYSPKGPWYSGDWFAHRDHKFWVITKFNWDNRCKQYFKEIVEDEPERLPDEPETES